MTPTLLSLSLSRYIKLTSPQQQQSQRARRQQAQQDNQGLLPQLRGRAREIILSHVSETTHIYICARCQLVCQKDHDLT